MRRMILVWSAALAAAIPSSSVQIRSWQGKSLNAIRNSPLPVAQQSLLLARSRVVDHCYSEAIPPLLTTAQALAFVQEQEIGRSGGFGGSAGWVRQEILDYTARIESNNTNALFNIDAWLHQVSQWMERRNRRGTPPSWNSPGRTRLHRLSETAARAALQHPRRLP